MAPSVRPALRATAHLAALAMALAVLAGHGAGCSRDARPAAQPTISDEPPPLPPASGTPIGFLLDDARLQLTDDQRTKLQPINDDLAAKLSYLDTVVRNTGSGSAPGEDAPRGGIGFSAAGDRGGQPPGKVSAQEGAGTGTVGGGVPSSATADNAAILKRVPEVRAYDIRTAIARALALLDPAQQKIARKVLVERGVDPDTGQFEAKGEPGSARTVK